MTKLETRDERRETVKASVTGLQLTPRKVGEVVALVRGRKVDDALIILSHTPRRAAKPVAKLIESAKANAINNYGLKAEGLVINTISVTSGPRLKRYRPVSRGMAHSFLKRTSHVYVTLAGNTKSVEKTKKVSQESGVKSHDSELITHTSKATKGAK